VTDAIVIYSLSVQEYQRSLLFSQFLVRLVAFSISFMNVVVLVSRAQIPCYFKWVKKLLFLNVLDKLLDENVFLATKILVHIYEDLFHIILCIWIAYFFVGRSGLTCTLNVTKLMHLARGQEITGRICSSDQVFTTIIS